MEKAGIQEKKVEGKELAVGVAEPWNQGVIMMSDELGLSADAEREVIVEGIRANGKDGKDLTPEGRQQQLQEFNEKLRRKEEMIENLEEELEQTKMEAQAKHSNP